MKEKIDFIGIGSLRSGTTWLARCLEEHPQILFSAQKTEKELHFFNSPYGILTAGWNKKYNRLGWSNYHKGIEWYLGQFPSSQKGKIRGEFTTIYLSDQKTAERIKKHFPEAKILVILRNPVEMIYSMHWHYQIAVELTIPRDFDQALKEGLYLDKGLYYKHLKKYFQLFPRKNIHVMIFDDLEHHPQQLIKDLYRFLKVKESFIPSVLHQKIWGARTEKFKILKKIGYIVINSLNRLGFKKIASQILWSIPLRKLYKKINVVPLKYPPMDSKVKNRLKKFYRSDIESLEKLIRRDLSNWK